MSSMGSATAGDQDHHFNLTGTSEEGCGTALTMQKKKARRVSFAETTSVHFFDRDDEETPPEALAKAGEGNGFQVNELNFYQLGNLRCDEDGDEEEDGNVSGDDEDGEPALRRSFLRPMESPSPGSTFGSATSNSENQFFGPVSPSFIRPSRLSDSAVSDDNHEVTMDSTAFSMHFRSLARSEAGVDLKTPPGTHLFGQEKTPECTQGNSMVLTETKKPISNSSLPVANASGESGSSDMSLIGEHSQQYDYGRLSPDLNALLAEGQHQIDMFSLSDNISASALPRNKKSDYLSAKKDESCTMGLDDSSKHDAGAAAIYNMPFVSVYAHATLDSSVSPSKPPDSGISVDNKALSSNKISKEKLVGYSMGASTDDFEDWRSKNLSSVNYDSPLSLHIPKDIPHQLNSPLTGAVSPSPIWRSPMHAVSNAQKYCSTVICSQKDPLIEKENMGSLVSSASIQKSISKLERLRASAFSSALSDRRHGVPVISFDFTKTSPLSSNKGKVNTKQVEEKFVSAPSFSEDEQISNIVQIEGQKRHAFSKDGNGIKALAHDEGKIQSPLISEDPKELLFTSERDSLPAECGGEKQASTTPCINFSPGKSLEKLSPSFQDYLFSPGRKSRFLGGSSSISAHKRKNELLIEHRDSQDAIITLQRSPKLQKYQGPDISECPDETCSGKPSELKYWTDVKSKFMESTDKWALLPTEKLNAYGIDVLQEFMNRIHSSKKYELLHHGLLSQKKYAHQNLLEKRTAELQLLLCRVVHEKVKLHLMRVKQEKLQEKFHSVCSGIQECVTLKFNSLPQLSTTYAKGLQLDASLQTFLVNLNRMPEAVRDKVSTMAQSLEDSDMKIANLIKYFNCTIKMKDELNCNDTIAFVKESLVKRTHCMFFHQEMQMFDIQSIRSSPGHHNLILNYLGILVQSLNIATGSTSSITIINELDNSAITKKFHNMDAYTAFSFVMEDEISRKLVGARSLAQEIQVTQSLLGNLIDVIQEAQLARRELRNLVDTRFCSSNDGELDLQLSFISGKSGIKVKATLVVSSLNRGIYPSETIPSVGAGRADGTKCDDEAFLWGIDNAVKSVKPGHFRIIRLCRSISNAI